MKIIRNLAIFIGVFSSVSCVTNTPPICYNKAVISHTAYDIPVFSIRKDVKTVEYLSGGPFAYQWTAKGNFTNTKSCDKLGITQ